jgi:hypothetical protein
VPGALFSGRAEKYFPLPPIRIVCRKKMMYNVVNGTENRRETQGKGMLCGFLSIRSAALPATAGSF